MILKSNSVLGLATGSSPIGIYKELIKKCEAGDIDFSDITTVNLDEYRGLPNHVNIDKARTHVPNGEVAKVTNCVDLQESTIEANKRFFASIDDVPRQAYTMGIGTIMAAKKILVVVSGADVTVVCDAAAYAELEK